MLPNTKSLEEIIAYAETQVRIYHLPQELSKQHVYIRILAQKHEQGKASRFNNPNPTTTVYEILETSDFAVRNRNRLEYIRAYHQLRLFGYDVWLQTFQAHAEPINEERKIKIEIATCRRMITKISNAIHSLETHAKKTLFPNLDENQDHKKMLVKLASYNERLNTAIADLDLFHYSIAV